MWEVIKVLNGVVCGVKGQYQIILIKHDIISSGWNCCIINLAMVCEK